MELTLTKAGAVMGAIAYLSPEQVRDEEVDSRSDLFSFGVVLYQLVPVGCRSAILWVA